MHNTRSHARESSAPAGRRTRGLVVALCAFGLLGALSAPTYGNFFKTSANASNSFSTAPFPAPTGLTLTGFTPAALSWTATSASWAAGTNVYRSTSAGGARTLMSTINGLATTTYSESPGLGAYYYEVKASYLSWLTPSCGATGRRHWAPARSPFRHRAHSPCARGRSRPPASPPPPVTA